MPKRSREEKLAAYSKGAKRGYRSRKAFVAANGLKMKEPSPGEVKALNVDPGRIVALRGGETPGSVDAEQTRLEHSKCNLDQNAQIVNRVFHPLS